MAYPAVQMPTIKVGTRLTDFAGLDLTVEGYATGGMGIVVWGRNAAKGNVPEALKLLRPDRLTTAAARSPEQRRAIERQFEDEALVWCHLWVHQCVVTANGLTRLSMLDNIPVLELDYAPNGSLRDQLRLGREEHTHSPLRAALAWAIHIATALAHIHQPDPAHDRPAPLVHCDLKPENVLLNARGWAQLTDLGLTRAYAGLAAETESSHAEGTAGSNLAPLSAHQAEVARLRGVLQAAGALPPHALPAPDAATLYATRTLRIPSSSAIPAGTSPARGVAAIGSRGPVAGSPPYMAPEQWEGLDAAVPATDLYAFGVLLYELFAGTETPHPFPFDPTPYLTPQLYAHALATGYDPALLAWHAAHTAPAGPAHHLTEPEVAEAALRSGPLTELADRAEGAGRRSAEIALQRLDALILACLARDPAARPSALALQQQLAALVRDPCALEAIHIPESNASTPKLEGDFWSNLGNAYSKLDREEEAIAAKRRAIQHNPTDAVNWINLGASLALMGLQKQREAAAAHEGRSWEASALAAEGSRYFDEALAVFKKAEDLITPEDIAEFPTLAAGLASNQGGVLSSMGRYAEAIAAFQRVLTLQPDALDTRFNLALAYAKWSQERNASSTERIERLQTAQSEIQAVLAVAPGYGRARALGGDIARALADAAHHFHG